MTAPRMVEAPEVQPGLWLIGRVVGRREFPARENMEASTQVAVDYGNVFSGNAAIYLPVEVGRACETGEVYGFRLDAGRQPKFYSARD